MRRLAIALAFALPIVAVLAFAANRHSGTDAPDRPAAGPYRGSEPPGRNLLPVFRLPTVDGGIVRSRDLRGRVVVTAFVDSACKESCPIIVAAVAAGLRRLEPARRRQVMALAISVDPKVDTAAHVRRFLRLRHAERELVYLVAPEQTMRPTWTAFHVLPAVDSGNAAIHSSGVRIFDRAGVWVSTLRAGLDLTAASIAHDVETALTRS